MQLIADSLRVYIKFDRHCNSYHESFIVTALTDYCLFSKWCVFKLSYRLETRNVWKTAFSSERIRTASYVLSEYLRNSGRTLKAS